MCTLQLTTMDGRKTYVNMDNVQHYGQRFFDKEEVTGTVIVFRDPDTMIVVAESAAEIYDMWCDFHLPSDEENEGHEDDADSTTAPN